MVYLMEQTNAGKIREGREQKPIYEQNAPAAEEVCQVPAEVALNTLSQENEYHDPSTPIKQEPIPRGKIARQRTLFLWQWQKFKTATVSNPAWKIYSGRFARSGF